MKNVFQEVFIFCNKKNFLQDGYSITVKIKDENLMI